MINRRQIQNQQMLLKALGFYRGKCDGIWGLQTTKAKQSFEVDSSFKPAYPSRGLPFSMDLNSKYPKGVYSDPKRAGMLTHEKLTEDMTKDWSSDLVTVHDNRKETVHISKPVDVAVVVETVAHVEEEIDLEPQGAPEVESKHSGQHHNKHNKKRR